MKIIERPSPNFDSRDGQAVDMLVLHYTGMAAATQALERLCDPKSRVSAHYVVNEEGAVYRLVAEENRAWHAGVSFWRGETNINQRSIGIEIVNPGHEFGYRDFPAAQIEAVIALCANILKRHAVPPRNVVGHSDIAPERKDDPGEKFPWRQLANAGVGLWPTPSSALSTPHSALSQYGYSTADLPKTITAFQRHFRPKLLNGQWDKECSALLAALLSMV